MNTQMPDDPGGRGTGKIKWAVRGLIAAIMAGIAALYALALMMQDVAQRSEELVMTPEIWLFVAKVFAFSAIGGWLAGLVLAPMFGRSGVLGWGIALVGGLLVSVLGGLIGGTLVFPGVGSIFGAILVFAVMADQPLLAVLWLVLMAGAHLVAMRLRRHPRAVQDQRPR